MNNLKESTQSDERSIQALVEGVDFVCISCSNGTRVKHDAKDYDPMYKEVLEKAFFEAENELPLKDWEICEVSIPDLQKKILKERYNVNYRTFHELNPHLPVFT